jgi:hypothetical protein
MNISRIHEKVFLLRQLNLPFDMIEEINGLCFYDKESTNTRINMRNILNVIKTPLMNGFDRNTGHWHFWADNNENQFQSQNCVRCGNYIYIIHYNTKLMCNCQNFHNLNLFTNILNII